MCVVFMCSGVSQLFGKGGQVFGEFGEAEIRTIDHVCFTATLGWTNWFAVTLVAQMSVFSTYTNRENVSLLLAVIIAPEA